VRNIRAPDGVSVTTLPPAWIKGQPLMAIYVYGVSRINAGEPVTLDVYQDHIPRQTVQIQFTRAPDLHVTVDGIPEEALGP